MQFEISSKPDNLPALNCWHQKKEISGKPDIPFKITSI
jgi:hypothetical protein